LAGETEVLGENMPLRHFVQHKSRLPDPGSKPGHRGGMPATNRMSYGAARLEFTMVCNTYRFTIGMHHVLQNVTEISIFFRLYGSQELVNDICST
jgi:hypothetical protein